MTTLTAAFAQTAQACGDEKTALIDGAGRHYSFYDLQAAANAYAAGWHARGVREGDRVLIAMGIGFELYAALAALWSLGATVVLPEPAMGLHGVKTAVSATSPRFFCASGPYRFLKWIVPGLWRAKGLLPRHRQDRRVPAVDNPDAIALISFTSGTTGVPKAIPRTHAFLMAQWRAVAPLLASNEREVDLVTFPVFVLINLAEGRTSVLPNWKMTKLGALAPDVLIDWIKAQGCTRALLAPSLCEKLTDGGDVGGLRHIFTGGGPVFPDVVRGLQQLSGSLAVTTVYGSTEAEPIAHLEAGFETGYGLLVGRPVDAVRLRIVDGEIQVAGAHVNTGYLDPARDAETKVLEGDVIWHRTGDAGRLDDQGRLWLLGRVGEEVQTPKGPLHPFAIEGAARDWPGVARAALLRDASGPVLAIEGQGQGGADYTARAAAFGIDRVVNVAQIPMDRRHHAKVDRPALRALLQQQG